MKVTVRADWMKACGFEAKDTEMEVVRVLGVMPNGKDRMYEVIRPNDNRVWVVSDWRIHPAVECCARCGIAIRPKGGHRCGDCGRNV